jgi:hypothetical protein
VRLGRTPVYIWGPSGVKDCWRLQHGSGMTASHHSGRWRCAAVGLSPATTVCLCSASRWQCCQTRASAVNGPAPAPCWRRCRPRPCVAATRPGLAIETLSASARRWCRPPPGPRASPIPHASLACASRSSFSIFELGMRMVNRELMKLHSHLRNVGPACWSKL